MCNYIQSTVLNKVEELASCGNENITIGIFGHCVSINCFLRSILSSNPAMTWKLRIDNTGVAHLTFCPKDGWFVVCTNSTSHLI